MSDDVAQGLQPPSVPRPDDPPDGFEYDDDPVYQFQDEEQRLDLGGRLVAGDLESGYDSATALSSSMATVLYDLTLSPPTSMMREDWVKYYASAITGGIDCVLWRRQ